MKKPRLVYLLRNDKPGSFIRRSLRHFLPELYRTERYLVTLLLHRYEVDFLQKSKVLALSTRQVDNYDGIIVGVKAINKHDYADPDFVNISKKFHKQFRILAVINAKARNLPTEDILDYYDLVIKREPYKDLGKYKISSRTCSKIYPTILGGTLPNVTTAREARALHNSIETIDSVPKNYKGDVFFSGGDTAPVRVSIVRYLTAQNVNFVGGIQYVKKPGNIDPDLQVDRLPSREFMRQINQTMINLAIEGSGEFTFRHLDIIRSTGFLLSTNVIDSLNLVIPFQEGENYVSFFDEGDLKDKIEYYLGHEKERTEICLNGRRLYSEFLDFSKYADLLANRIEI